MVNQVPQVHQVLKVQVVIQPLVEYQVLQVQVVLVDQQVQQVLLEMQGKVI